MSKRVEDSLSYWIGYFLAFLFYVFLLTIGTAIIMILQAKGLKLMLRLIKWLNGW
jgi:hypothetical protein